MAWSAAAQSQTTACEVSDVGYGETSGMAILTISLVCGGSGSPIPIDRDLLAGLTAYGEAMAKDEIAAPDAGTLPPNPRGAERKIIEDSNTESHDFEAQGLRIASDTAEVALTFEAPAEVLAHKPFLLFALWKAETKEDCDRTSRYERQGCRNFGYVIGYDLEDALVMSYPGLIRVQTDFGGGAADYEVQRWLVERYK